MKNIIISLIVFSILLSIVSIAHGQDDTQERSYQSCYTSFTSRIILLNLLNPPNCQLI
jgi:hypothetical protein